MVEIGSNVVYIDKSTMLKSLISHDPNFLSDENDMHGHVLCRVVNVIPDTLYGTGMYLILSCYAKEYNNIIDDKVFPEPFYTIVGEDEIDKWYYYKPAGNDNTQLIGFEEYYELLSNGNNAS